MMNNIALLFSYGFTLRALIAGTAIALCAALLGTVLTLRRYTMLSDGLSHTAFGAVAVAAVMGWSHYLVTLAVTVAAAFIILRIKENGYGGDAAIAVISTGALAVGMTVISIFPGAGVNMNEYLFGSILSMSKSDVYISLALSAAVIAAFVLCHRAIFAVTFDESFCAASGIKTAIYGRLLALLTAVTVVMGMKVVGALLMTNLLIYPAVSSIKLLRSFRGTLICGAVISVVCFFAGIAASAIWGTPAGSGIVIANIAVYLIARVISAVTKR